MKPRAENRSPKLISMNTIPCAQIITSRLISNALLIPAPMVHFSIQDIQLNHIVLKSRLKISQLRAYNSTLH